MIIIILFAIIEVIAIIYALFDAYEIVAKKYNTILDRCATDL